MNQDMSDDDDICLKMTLINEKVNTYKNRIFRNPNTKYFDPERMLGGLLIQFTDLVRTNI
jgi:hypothetical protein